MSSIFASPRLGSGTRRQIKPGTLSSTSLEIVTLAANISIVLLRQIDIIIGLRNQFCEEMDSG